MSQAESEKKLREQPKPEAETQQPQHEQKTDQKAEHPKQQAKQEQKQEQPKQEHAANPSDATQVGTVSQIYKELTRPEFLQGITDSLPKHVDPKIWQRHMLNYFRDHEQIHSCSLRSIHTALLNCAASGLDLGFQDQAYLVPYYNNKLRVNEARFIPGYRGLIVLMRNSGHVKNLWARVVFKNDYIEVIQGTTETLEHRPVWENPGDPVGVYSVATFQDGSTEFLIMTADEVRDVKEQALGKMQNPGNSPWSGPFEGEMWKKTIIRRHAKTLPLSAATRLALDRFEAHEDGRDGTSTESETIDITSAQQGSTRSEQVAGHLAGQRA